MLLYCHVETCFTSAAQAPPLPSHQPPSALDDEDCRDLEDYGLDPDGPDRTPDGDELAALLKVIPGITES